MSGYEAEYEEDDAPESSVEESPQPREALRGPALEKSIREDKNMGKSTTVGTSDVEEAVAQQRKRSYDPYPWRSGYGRTGKREAELHEYHQLAKKNGTSVPAALRDYHSIEEASRASPMLGIEASAQRMGWDPKRVAAEYAQHHFGQDGGRQLRSTATAYNGNVAAKNLIDEAATHPANKHLRDSAAVEWWRNTCSSRRLTGAQSGSTC